MTDWHALRSEYSRAGLHESDLTDEPLALFDRWLGEAIAADLPEPNALVLATADEAGRPSSRMVLLKGVTEYGFVFYTNLLSRKGRELAVNPSCALLFPWHGLERQVRVDGVASQLLREEVREYFSQRPRGAQVGAWASHQSHPVADREELETAYDEVSRRFPEGADVPPPTEWGGYVVRPEAVEFWQGRRDRLHDRLVYRRRPPGELGWTVERLAP